MIKTIKRKSSPKMVDVPSMNVGGLYEYTYGGLGEATIVLLIGLDNEQKKFGYVLSVTQGKNDHPGYVRCTDYVGDLWDNNTLRGSMYAEFTDAIQIQN